MLTQFGCGESNRQLMNSEKMIRGGDISNNLVQKRKYAHEVNLTYLLLLYFPCFLHLCPTLIPSFTAIVSFVLLLPPGYKD